MPSVSSNNRSHSAEMSLITRQMQRYDEADEARFLQQQADDAKLAIKHTWARMQDTARDAADLRWWTRRYPWYAVGGAGLLGFVAATSLSATRRSQPPAPQARAETASRSSIFSGMLSGLTPILRSALTGVIVGALQNNETEPSTEQQPSGESLHEYR